MSILIRLQSPLPAMSLWVNFCAQHNSQYINRYWKLYLVRLANYIEHNYIKSLFNKYQNKIFKKLQEKLLIIKFSRNALLFHHFNTEIWIVHLPPIPAKRESSFFTISSNTKYVFKSEQIYLSSSWLLYKSKLIWQHAISKFLVNMWRRDTDHWKHKPSYSQWSNCIWQPLRKNSRDDLLT